MIRRLIERIRRWREERHLRICPCCFAIFDERDGRMQTEDRKGLEHML